MKGTTMGQDFYYTVNVQNLSQDGRSDVQRFENENAARAFAASMAGILDDNGTLFDIDVYYVDIDHMTWLTGYSNLPE